MTDLPPGWELVRIDELCDINPRQFDNPPSDDEEVSFVPMVAMEAGTGRMDTSKRIRYGSFRGKSLTSFQERDVLFAKITPCMENGKVGVARNLQTGKGLGSTEFFVLRSRGAVLPEYLARYMLQPNFRQDAGRNMAGAVGQRRVPRAYLAEQDLPIPPLAEQRRIVIALDNHLSKLDTGISEAVTARSRVSDLWQSVLNRHLSRQGHDNAWSLRSLGELSRGGSYGTSAKCAYSGQGVAVVRIPNIIEGQIDLADMKYAMDAETDLSSLYLAAGDILFVRTNGSRSLIGRTAVAGEAAANIAFASYLIRFRLRVEIVRPRWIHYILASPAWRRKLEREAASSAGQYNLSLAKLERIEIPFPGLAEQDAILAELDDQRSVNDRLESSLVATATRAGALRRSLLIAAFSGRLAPQDPNDEPVSTLLERIKTERFVQPKVRCARRSPKSPNHEQGSLS